MLSLYDAAPISTRRKTADGYLVAEARAARTGIQIYSGAEVGRPDLGVVRVMRPENEVFDRASIATYGTAPITVGHPPGGVTADTWKRFAVGHVGEGVVRDGEYVALPLILKDADAIRQLETGTRELSVGYNCSLSWTPGNANGETWDAVQQGIRVNHVALVPKGRAGAECRIADAASPLTERAHTMADSITVPMGFLDAIPTHDASAVSGILADMQSKEVFRVRDAGRRARDLSWKYGAQMGPSSMHDSALGKTGYEFLQGIARMAPAVEAQLVNRFLQGDHSISPGFDPQAGEKARQEMIERDRNAWRGTSAPLASQDAAPPHPQPAMDSRSAYEAMCNDLSNAWKRGK